MPDSICFLFCRIRLHLHCQSRSELKRILEDGCFCKAHVLTPAIVELFECFFLLMREALFQVLVMPCHITEEFLHLLGISSAVLLRNYVSVPQFFYHIFHRLHLLLAQQHTTEERESPAFFRKNPTFFAGLILCLLRRKFWGAEA